jgi:hypothetical protein
MSIAISPRFTTEKLASGKLEDMIDVFEDQMRGWLIDPANQLVHHQHAGFGILAIVLSYFEPIGQFLDGKAGKSKAQFTRGLKAVFPDLEKNVSAKIIAELYDQLRCGMFHHGITKSKVAIAPSGPHSLSVAWGPKGELRQVMVVPRYLMGHLEEHLTRYVGELRDPANGKLRENFEKWFRKRAA